MKIVEKQLTDCSYLQISMPVLTYNRGDVGRQTTDHSLELLGDRVSQERLMHQL